MAQTERRLAENDRDLAQKERDLTQNRITSMLIQIYIHYQKEKGLIPFEIKVVQIEVYVTLEQMRFDELEEFGENFEIDSEVFLLCLF